MTWLDGLPVWGLAIAIFLLRIVDVSVGTVRTIAVVQGRVFLSVCLGFIEILVWVTVVAQVFQHAAHNSIVLLAYAAGFAAGNAVGIAIERMLALGTVILRIVSVSAGPRLAELLRQKVRRVYVFEGHEVHDTQRPMMLLYVVVKRREAKDLINLSRSIDPDLFFAVDPVRESSALLTPLPNATGWRNVFKMK